MAHSENSKMIQNYIALYQKGEISLSGLWYNIQTPLHTLFEKEERLQVQERGTKNKRKESKSNTEILLYGIQNTNRRKQLWLTLYGVSIV